MTSYKIVPLTIFNKYLYNETSKIEVNIKVSINNDIEKNLQKKSCDFQ